MHFKRKLKKICLYALSACMLLPTVSVSTANAEKAAEVEAETAAVTFDPDSRCV